MPLLQLLLQRRPSRPPRLRLDSPRQIPILTLQLRRVLRAPRAIAAGQRISGAIAVTAPADPLGVFGVQRKRFGHRDALHAWRTTMRRARNRCTDMDQATLHHVVPSPAPLGVPSHATPARSGADRDAGGCRDCRYSGDATDIGLRLAPLLRTRRRLWPPLCCRPAAARSRVAQRHRIARCRTNDGSDGSGQPTEQLIELLAFQGQRRAHRYLS
mgnify:CR=1 FL=1